jgi:hypothetical protein
MITAGIFSSNTLAYGGCYLMLSERAVLASPAAKRLQPATAYCGQSRDSDRSGRVAASVSLAA